MKNENKRANPCGYFYYVAHFRILTNAADCLHDYEYYVTHGWFTFDYPLL